ncbi:hypothetical protein BZK31_07125 [Pseudomonas floridensis]|uniref:Uncharacterized protein n=1 Tax=Pseudomonas floridensis TaxID=1958950 RepID=A0A1X0N8W3_9PSED|nr:hypothetical protein BZK31_07125 [Pseudomonas floridensis]
MTFKPRPPDLRFRCASCIELLNAQNDLAASEQKRVESVVSWYTARLQLAADLGQLNEPL